MNLTYRKDWQNIKLAEVCEAIIDCVNRTAPVVDQPTPYKMIRTTNIKNGWIDVEQVRYVTEQVYRRWSRRGELRKGDVILTREAPLGEVGMIRSTDTIFMGQRLIMYRTNRNKLDPKFLLYAMQQEYLQGQIKGFGSGSTVEHMRVPDAKELVILLPPIEAQHKIGGVLSAYDDLIENNLRRIVLLEQVTYNLYQEWFVHFRFPGRTGNASSEQSGIPHGWRFGAFTDFIDVLSGGTPSTKNVDYWDGDIPFFTPKDTGKFPYVITTQRNITQLGLNYCQSQLFPRNTVFITARGTVGKVRMTAIDMAMNQSCYALIGKEGINQLFVYFLTLQNADRLVKQATGAVFDTIIVNNFQRMNVAIPPNDLIAKFGEIATPVLEQIRNLIIRNQNLSTMRDLLLPRLISGELDVSELNFSNEDLEVMET